MIFRSMIFWCGLTADVLWVVLWPVVYGRWLRQLPVAVGVWTTVCTWVLTLAVGLGLGWVLEEMRWRRERGY